MKAITCLDLFCEEIVYPTQKNILSTQSQDIGVPTLPSNSARIGEGGVRLHGKHKETTLNKPLISVVTVVFNGALLLEDTILSVLNQSYDNIEYIVIDGGSTDGTVDILRKYESSIDYWVSEDDEGIYDAMNKGAQVAQGRYLHFLNAGDAYYKQEVLDNVSPTFKLDYPIVIGAAEFVYTKSQRVIKAARLSKLQMPNCHQSCFYLASEFKNTYYSTEYKILADFNYWFNEFVINQADVIIIDDIICSYDMNGISNKAVIKSLKEKAKIFYSSSLWMYRILGTIDILFTFIRINVARILQVFGIRAALVRIKLLFFS